MANALGIEFTSVLAVVLDVLQRPLKTTSQASHYDHYAPFLFRITVYFEQLILLYRTLR
jgi:hypothetical protein